MVVVGAAEGGRGKITEVSLFTERGSCGFTWRENSSRVKRLGILGSSLTSHLSPLAPLLGALEP